MNKVLSLRLVGAVEMLLIQNYGYQTKICQFS
jgi:hypothetical protein